VIIEPRHSGDGKEDFQILKAPVAEHDSVPNRNQDRRHTRGMSGCEPVAVVRQGCDGPSYRVRTETFQAWFVVGVDEDLESVANVDVDVACATA
jgi:hypothetical protein